MAQQIWLIEPSYFLGMIVVLRDMLKVCSGFRSIRAE